jgi:hypothetical protein
MSRLRIVGETEIEIQRRIGGKAVDRHRRHTVGRSAVRISALFRMAIAIRNKCRGHL